MLPTFFNNKRQEKGLGKLLQIKKNYEANQPYAMCGSSLNPDLKKSTEKGAFLRLGAI